MNAGVRMDQDYHVHSAFSDDAVSTVAENVAAARRRGLRTLCVADHVRHGTVWVPEFLAAVNALRPRPGLEVLAGLEATILDRAGTLDLPDGIDGADIVLIADHQFPGEHGPVPPEQMRDAIARGDATEQDVIEGLIEATASALKGAARPQLAHLFSILPKMGLAEAAVPDQAIAHLARQARTAGAQLEVNEKWACPSPRTVRAFAQAGVTLVAGTGSHDCRDVGVYASVRRIADGAFAGQASLWSSLRRAWPYLPGDGARRGPGSRAGASQGTMEPI
jgi:putative hydrolase